jgi:multisubunit Na+/H+ antiporter MnhE subunit
MGNTLYIIALTLIIVWLIGHYGYNLTEFIHVLLVTAVILILIRIIIGKRRAH